MKVPWLMRPTFLLPPDIKALMEFSGLMRLRMTMMFMMRGAVLDDLLHLVER
jgi:hypothetical protein